ncbi:MAG: excisionase family DNA-binding protein [Chloroflexi bacterium]|nr:excisionase family DNA-binding protein [Chloroflexota bacterium]
MVNAQGWTIEEAARALGVSDKTVRRRIKDGTIKAEQITGKYGPEYRIPEAQLASLRERPLPPLPEEPQDKPATPSAAPPTLSTAPPMDKALDMIKDLQAENERLAGQIGFLQAKLIDAESKLRLLQAPKSRVPWWRRLFRGRESRV